jgi:sn-1 stearoyl-lipid 9-desaturase
MLEFVLWFMVFYVWHVLGVTVGYHRLLAHRSFKCPKLVEYFFVIGGYLAFESSPIWWATLHRTHHRYTDTELDPHSPRFGNYHGYMGWIFNRQYPAHIDPKIQAPDLIDDPLYKLLERDNNWHTSHLTNTAIGFGSRLVMWLLFGWKIALASVLAGLIVQQVPFMVNLFCHKPKLGYQNYATTDDSVNVWWLTLITLGDNWHNNHHAYPGSARAGFRWFELDVAYLTIKLLSICKLATRVNSRFTLAAPAADEAVNEATSYETVAQEAVRSR